MVGIPEEKDRNFAAHFTDDPRGRSPPMEGMDGSVAQHPSEKRPGPAPGDLRLVRFHEDKGMGAEPWGDPWARGGRIRAPSSRASRPSSQTSSFGTVQGAPGTVGGISDRSQICPIRYKTKTRVLHFFRLAHMASIIISIQNSALRGGTH